MTTLQYADRNVGPGNYRHLAPDQLLVTSIFYTIQGEGPYAGCPAVFVRLAGCNRGRKEDMGCMFCDTKFHYDKGYAMKFLDIVAAISTYSREIPVLTVITGGEPMIQDNLSAFVTFHHKALPKRAIQIESNGDRVARGWFGKDGDDGCEQAETPKVIACVVISPKVGKDGYHRLSRDVMRAASCLKFVISAAPESHYYEIPAWAFEITVPERIFLSPLTEYKRPVLEGETASMWNTDLIDQHLTRLNYKRAAKLALALGMRLSIQQHLLYEVD